MYELWLDQISLASFVIAITIKTHKNIIVSIVVCGCKILSVILKKVYGTDENLGLKRDDGMRHAHNGGCHDWYSMPNMNVVVNPRRT